MEWLAVMYFPIFRPTKVVCFLSILLAKKSARRVAWAFSKRETTGNTRLALGWSQSFILPGN